MKTSSKGINLIRKWEQFRAKAYQDSVGVWTIGYGHTRTASKGEIITVSEAVKLLKQDILIVETYVNNHYPNLRQCQFDALVSLLYNIGFGNFKKTHLSQYLKDVPDSKYIADEWIEFRNAGGKYFRGLLRRRLDELSLYYSC